MENSQYVVEMLNITKRFKGIVANDNITIQLKRGEKGRRYISEIYFS